MTVAIIDTGGANLSSLRFAFRRLGVESSIVSTRDAIARASHLILPGVGAADVAMARLKNFGLVDVVRATQKPTLGICLGMQLLFAASDEGYVDCLGILPGRVERLRPKPERPVPHMGWNSLNSVPNGAVPALLRDVAADSQFYFVHSYRAPDSVFTLRHAQHGDFFPAVVQKDNFYGVQFHPEKSSAPGAALLRSFLEL